MVLFSKNLNSEPETCVKYQPQNMHKYHHTAHRVLRFEIKFTRKTSTVHCYSHTISNKNKKNASHPLMNFLRAMFCVFAFSFQIYLTNFVSFAIHSKQLHLTICTKYKLVALSNPFYPVQHNRKLHIWFLPANENMLIIVKNTLIHSFNSSTKWRFVYLHE